MRAVDLIRTKRDGGSLEEAAIEWLIDAYTKGDVGDDQMAAFTMAVFFRGMSGAELAALVRAMLESGRVMDLADIPGKKVDKHSTGGVGDKISICLAPLVAACGVPVPMISGRALGHTGGTLDKLSAIPGFTVDIDDDRFVEIVREHNLALIGQTASLAPADKKLYALRDVTGTVESIPLIAASIMSKKLAEGIDGLVLDVKVGSGAFMKSVDDARALARTMISIGDRMNKKVRALVTDMNQVLGRACGNANETWEAIEVLRGGGPEDVVTLTVEIGAEMLVLGGVADSLDDGKTRMRRAIADGRGLEKLRKVVQAQGGDPASLDARDKLPTAKHTQDVTIDRAGIVSRLDVEAIGRAAMVLGAGRAKSSDAVDLSVGFDIGFRLGDTLEAGQPIARADYNDEGKLAAAKEILLGAIELSEEAPEPTVLIKERLGEL
ncbi:MAG: thymidine phosphorylase [Deltaproteobacteria bacterium]|jgi:pyrimidine-nucleoside phosphorylase